MSVISAPLGFLFNLLEPVFRVAQKRLGGSRIGWSVSRSSTQRVASSSRYSARSGRRSLLPPVPHSLAQSP